MPVTPHVVALSTIHGRGREGPASGTVAIMIMVSGLVVVGVVLGRSCDSCSITSTVNVSSWQLTQETGVEPRESGDTHAVPSGQEAVD